MTYREAIQWMYGKLPMYQQQGKSAYNNKLDKSIAFSKHLNHPERQFPSIHIAGTNGKGSTSHMLASVLQEAGYKTGLYTSPHLKDFRERIRINGQQVSKDTVIDFIAEHHDFLETHKLSFFEMTVGMAFACFAAEQVNIAVIETGLGGRLDSTNIITPEVAVITNIAYDHTHILGDTLEKIAHEKAGIIKPDVPVVLSEYQKETFPVFKAKAAQCNAPLILADEVVTEDYKSDLLGNYQVKNKKGVLAILKQLKNFPVQESHIKQGLLHVVKNTGLKGRWQQLGNSPKVICDVAHNAVGLSMVFDQIKSETFHRLHVVFGMVKDKDIEAVFSVLPKEASYYFCSPNVPRGLAATQLQEKAQTYGFEGSVYSSVSEACKKALEKASPEDFIYIGGSAFVVAEAI
ncbi:MAG: folylpolyglutamate synthase/dihydrofolate synthase family protein [Bacteroidota bacterium]